jgi:hypothetical protein
MSTATSFAPNAHRYCDPYDRSATWLQLKRPGRRRRLSVCERWTGSGGWLHGDLASR